jgi:hypothetical protein
VIVGAPDHGGGISAPFPEVGGEEVRKFAQVSENLGE